MQCPLLALILLERILQTLCPPGEFRPSWDATVRSRLETLGQHAGWSHWAVRGVIRPGPLGQVLLCLPRTHGNCHSRGRLCDNVLPPSQDRHAVSVLTAPTTVGTRHYGCTDRWGCQEEDHVPTRSQAREMALPPGRPGSWTEWCRDKTHKSPGRSRRGYKWMCHTCAENSRYNTPVSVL